MQSSLERINPDTLAAGESTGYETLQLHLDRYHYAARFMKKGTCADIACGTGYGSFILVTQYAHLVDKIIAVDIDLPSIEWARSRYSHPSIEYIQSDALAFKSSRPLQNIISLETIEHLPDPKAFVHHMNEQLSAGGRFIASVPITPSMDVNPYHLHDFTRNSFLAIFSEGGFTVIDSFVQVQPYKLFSVLSKKEERSKDLRKGMFSYYLTHPSKFFLRLSSLLVNGFKNKYLVAIFEKS